MLYEIRNEIQSLLAAISYNDKYQHGYEDCGMAILAFIDKIENQNDMKNIEKLKQEQQELKERLQRLIDYVNSEEYFTIPESEKSLLNSQRMGMEIYLNALTNRIYSNSNAPTSFSSSVLPLMLGMLSVPPSSGWGPSSTDELKKIIAEHEDETDKKQE